ncbi:tRNA pseudouridine32 synthase / 23S rRNA pseudouridine746 synthase [Aliidiomarina maris]|nr:tRNA pseudouridine32 synthase / 23S rRNA pseudouridine746 synthase [Aliidiomarina maris]
MHQEGEAIGLVTQVEALVGEKLFPVHRLDKDTSGLVILARHAEAAAIFGRLFEQREIDKFYVAVAGNKPAKKQGAIQGDMEKARGGSWRLTKSQQAPAKTWFFSFGTGQGTRLYVLKPLTGRTHQIRVALKSIGVPILGDSRYKGKPAQRLMLHALALGFTWRGEKLSYLLLPDSDFYPLNDELTAKLNQPWDLPWPQASV